MRFKDAILNDIYGEKISENIAIDNNGQLICSNCVLARTGYYDYRESELIDGGSEDKIVRVYRSPEEVFDEASIKSMNFKPFVNDHPEDNVTPESVSYLQKGFIINARRGEGEFSECLMADIVVTDPYIIDLIKSGDKRELSVGYTSDIEEKDGKYFMKNIRGNHVALCEAGRAGIAKIRDSKTVSDSNISTMRKLVEKWAKENKLSEEIIDILNKNFPEASPEDRQEAFEKATNLKFALKYFTDSIIQDSELSPSTIKLSNGSIVNFYGWCERNGYGTPYYSIGVKTRSGFIFKTHFENEQLAKNCVAKSGEDLIVVRSMVGVTKSEVVDSLKKFTVKVNGKSYATNARTHADAVKKVSRVLNDTIQYPEAKQLISKARDLGFLFEGQIKGDWVFHFGSAPFESLSILAEEGKKINPNYKQVVHGSKIFIGDSKTLWLVNVGQDKPIKKVYASSESKARAYFESKGFTVNAVGKSLMTPMNSSFIETADDLIESSSEEALSKNIATEVKAGKPVNQAVAIAKSVQSESKDEKDQNQNSGPDCEYLPDSSDVVGKDAIEDGTYEFITIKNGETDSTFIKARSKEEAVAIFRSNNRAGKLLECGVWEGGRYRAFSDSLDSQSTEKMAQLKYDELKKELNALENEIDRNDDNPNYNLVSKSRELEKIQDEISKLKKDFGYAITDEKMEKTERSRREYNSFAGPDTEYFVDAYGNDELFVENYKGFSIYLDDSDTYLAYSKGGDLEFADGSLSMIKSRIDARR